MTDFPVDLPDGLAPRLTSVLDVEGKLPRALDALGPVADRDVVLVGGGDLRARQLTDLGARVTAVDSVTGGGAALPSAGADAVVSCWSAFRGVDGEELGQAARLLRPGGRLLAVHDYGRDDVSQLYAEATPRPEYGSWSRRDGPFLGNGFKVRVVHCWWTFADLDAARDFLGDAFGEVGRQVGAELRRPRLSYNLAIYHRTFGDGAR